MLRSLSRRTWTRLAFASVAAISLAACAKKAKPSYPVQPPPAAEAPRTEMPPPPSDVGQQSTAPAPGSTQDFIVNVGDRVYFDTDSHDVRADAEPVLGAQADWLRKYSSVRIRIEGNCDERGTREYNLALGARRANAVRDFLVSRGVTADRISTISFGKEQPIDAGSSEESWQKNRNGHTAIVSGAR